MSWSLLRISTANERGRHALWLTCCCCCCLFGVIPQGYCVLNTRLAHLGFFLAISLVVCVCPHHCPAMHFGPHNSKTMSTSCVVWIAQRSNDWYRSWICNIFSCVGSTDLTTQFGCFPALRKRLKLATITHFFEWYEALVGVAREITGICCNGILQVLVNNILLFSLDHYQLWGLC